jgi:ATP-dependent RNA helicase RhlE
MSNRFSDFRFREEITRALDDAGYDTPSPIQKDAIPILLEGNDLIGVAETGTGKTLAFLLPIYQRMEADPIDPRALVICPTRELAIQVAKEAERFGKHLGIRTVLAYGGTSSGEQKRALAEGCDLVVGTPGRLLDFVTSAWLSLRKLRYLVLDEADRMLDMGFIKDVDAILRKSPMSRQTALFSATFPEEIRRLSDRYMLHPSTVKMHEGTQVAPKVDHAFYPVTRNQKESLLLEILRQEKPGKALIFTATREATSEVGLVLRKGRHEVVSLSSLLSQPNRERALDAFRTGACNVLVATDVAARGLDIFDIDLVVNFDVPMQAEDYVHRIGRTGRAGRKGKAVTLICELDARRTGDIERLLGLKIPRIQIDGFDYRPMGAPSSGGRPRRGGPGQSSGRPGGPGRRTGKSGGAPGRRKGGGRGRGPGSGGR